MTGQEIINYIVSAKMPDREQIRENCKRQPVPDKRRSNRALLRAATATAVMAALCIIFGKMLWKGENTFIIKAYAMERQEDESVILREVDIASELWGGYYDAKRGLFYVNIGLTYEGKNIKRVEYSVERGFLAKQGIPESDAPMMYIGEESRLVMSGTDFEIVGERISVDSDANESLLFWGMEIAASEFYEVSSTLKTDICAVATFENGSTVARTIPIDLSKSGAILHNPGEAEMEAMRRNAEQAEHIRNLALEDLELVPESVKPLKTEDGALYYVYDVGRSDEEVLIQTEYIEFDGNGLARKSVISAPDGSQYLVVIRRGSDGGFTGMLYKVPAQYKGELR